MSEKTYICEECGQSFVQLVQLKIHQRTHTGVRPFVCEECGKAFTTPDNLKVHQRWHTGERPYVCEECGKVFTTSDHLKVHRRYHIGERPYVCEECGQAFAQSASLTGHMWIHTGERPYVCEECGQAFAQFGSLKTHLRTHTDERPYVCEECGKSFCRKHHLTFHMEAEACWYLKETEVRWEELCKEIAGILLQDTTWEWKPRLDTPFVDECAWVVPEIIITQSDQNMEFIDAKRSTYAATYKDLVIYPRLANKVTFWCLYGDSNEVSDQDVQIVYTSSKDLIIALEKRRDEGNQEIINALIWQILALKQGLDISEQTQLQECVENNSKKDPRTLSQTTLDQFSS